MTSIISFLGRPEPDSDLPGGEARAVRRRIVVGPIDPTFEPARDIPFGPWCFAGAEDVYPEWESLDFTHPIATPDEVKQADDAIAALANRLVIELAGKMNARHGVNYGMGFWHLVLMRWVLEVIYVCHMRYREAEALVERHSGEALVASIPAADTCFDFTCMRDFISRGVIEPKFSAWVAGCALRLLAPPGLRLNEFETVAPVPSQHASPQQSHSIARRAFAAIKDGRFNVGLGVNESGLAEKLKSAATHAAFHLFLCVIPRKHDIGIPDPAERASDAADDLPAAILELARSVLERALPRTLQDDFARLDRAASRRPARPGRLQVRLPAFQLDEEKLFRIAHAVDGGEGLVFVQHGANYGVSRAYSIGAETEYRYHGFITWGWTRHGDDPGRFVALPSPHMSPYRGRHRDTEGSLLLTATAAQLWNTRTINVGNLFDKTTIRAERCRFLDALAPDVRATTLYRPYLQGAGNVEDGPYFKRRYPSLRQCCDGFRDSVLGCRLLVVDHPGVTMYLALAANVPFVGFWDPETWARCEQAEPNFAELQRLGILFDNGEAAAHRVNEIWPCVETWWREPELQAHRVSMADNFALARRGWWLQWMKALWQL